MEWWVWLVLAGIIVLVFMVIGPVDWLIEKKYRQRKLAKQRWIYQQLEQSPATEAELVDKSAEASKLVISPYEISLILSEFHMEDIAWMTSDSRWVLRNTQLRNWVFRK